MDEDRHKNNKIVQILIISSKTLVTHDKPNFFFESENEIWDFSKMTSLEVKKSLQEIFNVSYYQTVHANHLLTKTLSSKRENKLLCHRLICFSLAYRTVIRNFEDKRVKSFKTNAKYKIYLWKIQQKASTMANKNERYKYTCIKLLQNIILKTNFDWIDWCFADSSKTSLERTK